MDRGDGGPDRVFLYRQADPNTPGGTRTVQTSTYRPGSVYYNWASISTFPTTIPIVGVIALLALAGWTAATSANPRTYDKARLKCASNYAFVAVGIGIVGGVYFLIFTWWEGYEDYWLDAAFYGLIFGAGTAAILLRMLASAPRPELDELTPLSSRGVGRLRAPSRLRRRRTSYRPAPLILSLLTGRPYFLTYPAISVIMSRKSFSALNRG
jgi:hypothetical protein